MKLRSNIYFLLYITITHSKKLNSKYNKSTEDEKRAEVYRAEFVVYYVDRREPQENLKGGEGRGMCDMTKFVSGQYRGWFTRG